MAKFIKLRQLNAQRITAWDNANKLFLVTCKLVLKLWFSVLYGMIFFCALPVVLWNLLLYYNVVVIDSPPDAAINIPMIFIAFALTFYISWSFARYLDGSKALFSVHDNIGQLAMLVHSAKRNHVMDDIFRSWIHALRLFSFSAGHIEPSFYIIDLRDMINDLEHKAGQAVKLFFEDYISRVTDGRLTIRDGHFSWDQNINLFTLFKTQPQILEELKRHGANNYMIDVLSDIIDDLFRDLYRQSHDMHETRLLSDTAYAQVLIFIQCLAQSYTDLSVAEHVPLPKPFLFILDMVLFPFYVVLPIYYYSWFGFYGIIGSVITTFLFHSMTVVAKNLHEPVIEDNDSNSIFTEIDPKQFSREIRKTLLRLEMTMEQTSKPVEPVQPVMDFYGRSFRT